MRTTIKRDNFTHTINRDPAKYTLLIFGWFGLSSHKDFDTRREAEETARKYYELCAADGCFISWDNIQILDPSTI